MEKVSGVGGIFIRAKDPEALSKWYTTHLGIDGPIPPCQQSAGPLVFSPFKEDSDYFPAKQQVMINYRVANLDRMIAQLKAADIEVETRDEWNHPKVGQFARIKDPEGNDVELWQPAEKE